MSNIVYERIAREKTQKINFVRKKEQPKEIDEMNQQQEKDSSPPISPEILKQELLKKINPKPKITMNEQSTQTEEPVIELIHFSALIEFVSWYEQNSDKFSEGQNKALKTLTEARDMTLGGCNCDREKRKYIAEDYFKKFWVTNQSTDLLPTLLKIVKSKKIIFGDFLSYPS
jgi:hypothetical protein